MTDETDALARVNAEHDWFKHDDHLLDARDIIAGLKREGYKIVPIEQRCAIRNRRYGPCALAKGHDGLHQWSSIEQAAEAADREAAVQGPTVESRKAASPSAAVAPLDVEVIARIFADGRIDEFWDVGSKARAFAAAYAAAKDNPSSPDGLDGEAGG